MVNGTAKGFTDGLFRFAAALVRKSAVPKAPAGRRNPAAPATPNPRNFLLLSLIRFPLRPWAAGEARGQRPGEFLDEPLLGNRQRVLSQELAREHVLEAWAEDDGRDAQGIQPLLDAPEALLGLHVGGDPLVDPVRSPRLAGYGFPLAPEQLRIGHEWHGHREELLVVAHRRPHHLHED